MLRTGQSAQLQAVDASVAAQFRLPFDDVVPSGDDVTVCIPGGHQRNGTGVRSDVAAFCGEGEQYGVRQGLPQPPRMVRGGHRGRPHLLLHAGLSHRLLQSALVQTSAARLPRHSIAHYDHQLHLHAHCEFGVAAGHAHSRFDQLRSDRCLRTSQVAQKPVVGSRLQRLFRRSHWLVSHPHLHCQNQTRTLPEVFDCAEPALLVLLQCLPLGGQLVHIFPEVK